MRYSLISFDLDGTLLETAGEIAAAVNLTLAEFDLPRQPLACVAGLIGAGTRELMLRLLARLAPALPRGRVDQLLARFDVHYGATAGTLATPYPGCRDALQALRDAGVKLACLSNKEERFARRLLDATRLLGHFELLVGGDSLPHRKPHPSTLAHVLHVLGVEAGRAAHVGDSHLDVETAHAAGVAAWAVPYGYNGGAPIAAAGPQRIFESLGEISAHVLAANSACGPSRQRLYSSDSATFRGAP